MIKSEILNMTYKEIVEDTKLFLKMSIDTNKKLDIMPDLLKGKQMALRITLDFINDCLKDLSE